MAEQVEMRKIVFFGDCDANKMQLMSQLDGIPRSVNGHRWAPIIGTSVHPITYNHRQFACYLTTDNPNFCGLREGYFISAHGGLYFPYGDEEKDMEMRLRFSEIAPDAQIIDVNSTNMIASFMALAGAI